MMPGRLGAEVRRRWWHQTLMPLGHIKVGLRSCGDLCREGREPIIDGLSLSFGVKLRYFSGVSSVQASRLEAVELRAKAAIRILGAARRDGFFTMLLNIPYSTTTCGFRQRATSGSSLNCDLNVTSPVVRAWRRAADMGTCRQRGETVRSRGSRAPAHAFALPLPLLPSPEGPAICFWLMSIFLLSTLPC